MPRARVLIEQWLPIDQIGAERMRERGASSALPPLYFLRVWWARRPLTVSRAAILASLLPAYPTGEDDSIRAWPRRFLYRFPTFDAYKHWFLSCVRCAIPRGKSKPLALSFAGASVNNP
jgi:putative DNA methylase